MNPDSKNFCEINVDKMLTLKSAYHNYVEIKFRRFRKLECLCSHVRETQMKHVHETDTL